MLKYQYRDCFGIVVYASAKEAKEIKYLMQLASKYNTLEVYDLQVNIRPKEGMFTKRMMSRPLRKIISGKVLLPQNNYKEITSAYLL